MNLTRLKWLLKELAARNQLDLLPLRKQLQGYGGKSFQGDARAGFNVALLAFPQGMAYALIAGLPIEYGIFGSAVAAIVGAMFAGSRFIVLGPTNATSVMLASSFAALGVFSATGEASHMPLLLIMVGLFLIVGAYLRVANLIQYISTTVVTGYITAAALLIIAGQIKNVIGVRFAPGEQAITFVDKVYYTVKHLPEFHHEAVILSLLTLGLYWLLRRFRPSWPNVAITLVLVSAAAAGLSALSDYLSQTQDIARFWHRGDIIWLGSVDASNWPLTLPTLNFDAISQMSNAALAIALLCVLEGTSIGKSLAARSGERLDANQEMLSIGAANIGCAFFAGMPASGSLTRSKLSWDSGSRTPLAAMISGLIVAVGAFIVGPLIGYIPQAVLAVLVILIGISLVNERAIKIVTRATRSDAATFFVTFLAGLLFPLDTAIYFGVGLSIVLFLRKAATPELVEYGFTDEGELAELEAQKQRRLQEISIVHVEGDLFFGAAELFRDQLRRVCEDPLLKIVVVKMRNARNLDATCVMSIEELVRFMDEKDRHLILSECRPDVIGVLRNSGIFDMIGEENVFTDTPQNPTLSTAKALKRAQQILGGAEADIKIYVNPNKGKTVDEVESEE